MEILGIGLQELFFIGLILLLVLGPTELITLGRKSGRLLRRARQSDTWIMIANLAQALRNLPNALADETRADEIFRDVVPTRDRRTIAPPDPDRTGSHPRRENSGQETGDGFTAWTTRPTQKTEPAGTRAEETPGGEQGEPDTDPSGSQ
jgi:Sec-independent protein translocase protein TatA